MNRVFYFILGALTVLFGKDIAKVLIKGFMTAREEIEGLATQIAEDLEDEAVEAEFHGAAKPEEVYSKAPKESGSGAPS